MIIIKLITMLVMLILEALIMGLGWILAIPRLAWEESETGMKDFKRLGQWTLSWELKNPITDKSTNQNRFNLMVALAIVFIVSFLFTSKVYGSEYSEGYRMGQLTKFSVKGHFIKSGEGELSMGREGSFYEKCKGSGTERSCKVINPFKFSSETEQVDELNKYSGKYVVIQYKEVLINNPLKYSSPYRIVTVSPIDKKIDLDKGYIGSVPGGTKSKGFRVGRIVKASYKGVLAKTYEVIVQIGNSGNQYKHMSTKDLKLYEFAIKTLKSAKKVKLLYTERGFLQFSLDDTKYQLYGIETLEDI